MSEEPRRESSGPVEWKSGREYWRTLSELTETPELREAVRREFPPGADEPPGGMSRRNFLKLLGASAALAGVSACTRQPAEKILPYASRPPELTPGIPLHYATSMLVGGYATGLLVESHEGRPTKVEGNPEHPASLGAAGVYEQASVLQLYDPHRARTARRGNRSASWSDFVHSFTPQEMRRRAGERGSGLHLLLEPTSSPLIATLLAHVRTAYPDAGIHFYAPLASRSMVDATRALFGRGLQPQFDFRRAEVVVALDADFLSTLPFHLRYARDFAERRRVERPSDPMSRLYAVEGQLSVTGAAADHRLRVRTGEVQRVAAAILAEVIDGLRPRTEELPREVTSALERFRRGVPHGAWVAAVAGDLRASAGRSIVVAGERQPPVVHAIANLLNAALGNVGATVWYAEPPILEAGEASHDLRPLVEAMRQRQVSTLILVEGNPAYASPADLEFGRLVRDVPRSVYLGLYEDETARNVTWFVPATHYLESWGDARAYDGTLSVVQPLISPLYAGKTAAEVLSALAGVGDRGAHELLQESWRTSFAGRQFEPFWEETLQRGLVRGSEFARSTPSARWSALPQLLQDVDHAASAQASTIEVVFAQSHAVYDGRFADNAWLQELPDPMTKLTWDNAAVLSPRTARRLGVEQGDMLLLCYGGRALHIPALVLPGHADGSVSLQFGYGRQGGEVVARNVGANAYAIWPTIMPYYDNGLTVERALDGGGAPLRRALATTQTHWTMEGRPIVRQATLEQYRAHPDFTTRQKGRVLSLYEPDRSASGDQWAMTIDLSACTGCNACVVACQAENNVPVVGREGVLSSREMHWLRIDRYFAGPPDDPTVVTQPMLCQHCEKAPCEYVCPVNATVHSGDGLNEMVYNRCVGTRFCSNNCPYKVRRFNWFDYNAEITETERMVKNPDVTVRDRGVMEKCTFCVQRIRRAQIDAALEGRGVRDGEVMTACQQACPTRAILFGSLTDRTSEVARSRSQQRSYEVLHELGTSPRVSYLARITKPNPALAEDW